MFDNSQLNISIQLGVCYYYGNGVLKDTKKAKEWIKKSRDSGYKKAKMLWDKLELWKY